MFREALYMRILLVEDDQDLGMCIKEELSKKYAVDHVKTSAEALYAAKITPYDMYILDIMLPGKHGIAICQALRNMGIKSPILMLTARKHTAIKVIALDSGADDYLTKPFSFDELQARIRALLRRIPETILASVLEAGDIRINLATRQVWRKSREIIMRRKEFDLLEYLMRNVDKVVTRSMILEHVWETGLNAMSNTVDVHIRYLREKLDHRKKRKYIVTVPGVGYKILGGL